MPIGVVNSCRVDEARREEARDLLLAYAEDMRANEPGCLLIDVFQDAADPSTLMVYTEFLDDATYEQHLASQRVAVFHQRIYPLVGDTHRKKVYRTFVG